MKTSRKVVNDFGLARKYVQDLQEMNAKNLRIEARGTCCTPTPDPSCQRLPPNRSIGRRIPKTARNRACWFAFFPSKQLKARLFTVANRLDVLPVTSVSLMLEFSFPDNQISPFPM